MIVSSNIDSCSSGDGERARFGVPGGALWLMLSQQVPSVTEESRLTLGSAPDCAIHETRSRSRSRFCADAGSLRPLLGSPRESRGGAPKRALAAPWPRFCAFGQRLRLEPASASRFAVEPSIVGRRVLVVASFSCAFRPKLLSPSSSSSRTKLKTSFLAHHLTTVGTNGSTSSSPRPQSAVPSVKVTPLPHDVVTRRLPGLPSISRSHTESTTRLPPASARVGKCPRSHTQAWRRRVRRASRWAVELRISALYRLLARRRLVVRIDGLRTNLPVIRTAATVERRRREFSSPREDGHMCLSPPTGVFEKAEK